MFVGSATATSTDPRREANRHAPGSGWPDAPEGASAASGSIIASVELDELELVLLGEDPRDLRRVAAPCSTRISPSRLSGVCASPRARARAARRDGAVADEQDAQDGPGVRAASTSPLSAPASLDEGQSTAANLRQSLVSERSKRDLSADAGGRAAGHQRPGQRRRRGAGALRSAASSSCWASRAATARRTADQARGQDGAAADLRGRRRDASTARCSTSAARRSSSASSR